MSLWILFHLLVFALPISKVAAYRIWDTVYLDQEKECGRFVDNDNMDEGDIYMVKSDSWNGGSHIDRRPAECATSFNLGDRHIAIKLVEMRCDKSLAYDPFVAVYDNCHGRREFKIAEFNCSNQPSAKNSIFGSTSCALVYHYRGHNKGGYYFGLNIVAGEELIAFPVGIFTGVIIGCIVAVLIVVKIIFVITGYENRLPKITVLDIEEQKEILVSQQSPVTPRAFLGGRRDNHAKEINRQELRPGETISNEAEISKLVDTSALRAEPSALLGRSTELHSTFSPTDGGVNTRTVEDARGSYFITPPAGRRVNYASQIHKSYETTFPPGPDPDRSPCLTLSTDLKMQPSSTPNTLSRPLSSTPSLGNTLDYSMENYGARDFDQGHLLRYPGEDPHEHHLSASAISDRAVPTSTSYFTSPKQPKRQKTLLRQSNTEGTPITSPLRSYRL